ncbi:MAG: universal stress protein [Candidatus Nitrosopumilus sp. bin_68KS]
MKLSFNNILVPYDGTKTGDRAFDGAIQLAKKFCSKITILSCIERESTWGFFETKSDKKNIKKRHSAMCEKTVKLHEIASKQNIQCKVSISNCSVASECVVSFVKSHKIDLIVMGKSSKINPEKIYHDSTVNYIYSHLKCPMLTI